MRTGPENIYRDPHHGIPPLSLPLFLMSALVILLLGCGENPLTRIDSAEISYSDGLFTWTTPFPVLSKFRYGDDTDTGLTPAFVYPSGRRFVRMHASYPLGSSK